MFDKATIFNLALDALLLNYQTIDPNTDNAPQIKKLRLMWLPALSKTLADLDLDRTKQTVILEKIPDAENAYWRYVYKYPADCAKFRRICSNFNIDNKETLIPSATGIHEGQSVIYCNVDEASAEVILAEGTPLSALNPPAGLALAYQLAIMSSALIVGKGARELKQSLQVMYNMHKAEAQENDINENVDTTPDEFESEFVYARLGGKTWPLKT